MASNCCGICIYGKNEHKYADGTKNECMLDGYHSHFLNESCPKFKRDLNKKITVKSIHDVKR